MTRRWERLAIVLGICLPVPVLATTGLSLPLPQTVERLAAALVPWSEASAASDNQALSTGTQGTIVRVPEEIAATFPAAAPASNPRPAPAPTGSTAADKVGKPDGGAKDGGAGGAGGGNGGDGNGSVGAGGSTGSGSGTSGGGGGSGSDAADPGPATPIQDVVGQVDDTVGPVVDDVTGAVDGVVDATGLENPVGGLLPGSGK